MDTEIYSIICSNIRVAEQRIGDVKAQATALLVGRERLQSMIDKHGAGTLKTAIGELKARAAQQMRHRISQIPDGSYRGTAIVDSDGVVNEPLTIQVNIEKQNSELHINLTAPVIRVQAL